VRYLFACRSLLLQYVCVVLCRDGGAWSFRAPKRILLLAILLFGPMVGFAEDDAAAIYQQLDMVSRKHNAKLVISSGAYSEVKRLGAEHADKLLLSKKVVGDWQILYSSSEDPEVIVSRYIANLVVWRTAFDKSAIPNADSMLRFDLLAVGAGFVNESMRDLCKTNLAFSEVASKSPITLIGAGYERLGRLCEDYMLFLSASGIKVKHEFNKVIGVIE
jgi:hypothetical protein